MIAVLFSRFIASICIIFIDPILVLWLEYLSIEKRFYGFGFALMCFTFTIGSVFVGDLAHKLGKRPVMVTSSMMMAISGWLLGGLWMESALPTWIGLGI